MHEMGGGKREMVHDMVYGDLGSEMEIYRGT
jgi:hypothetical protein